MRFRSALSIITFTAAVALAGPAFADGDAAKGEKVFNKCKACHSTDAGKNKVGPSLHNIFGRAPGSVEGFKYSDAMKEFGASHTWDDETLHAYLEKPKELVPGNKMAFVGLNKEQDRDDVIAYLKTLSQ